LHARPRCSRPFSRASIERSEFIAEHRLLMADGSVKYVRSVAHPSTGKDPKRFVFIGAIMDVTERKRAEEERERLSQLEAVLAHMNRVGTMDELAASLAHEIKQPIAAAAFQGQACTNWLGGEALNLKEASKAASAMFAAVMQASHIIDRVSSL
jgi:signal transduction histidine kinase